MSREIKFRAWDKETEQYFKLLAIDFKSKIVSCRHFKWKYDPFNQINLNDFDLEQFTGLQDSNGDDIYEGDIVRMQRPGFHERACYEVKYFVKDVCIFQIVKVTDGSTLFESPSNGHDVEIVGNVHSNPELLEAEK